MNTDYSLVARQIEALIDGELDAIAVLSNVSAILNESMDNINWVGFYFMKNNQLVLGPFQGKVACYRIPLDKGVCGKAVSTNSIQRIADVHAFPGHIACDSASESEIVLPLVVNGKIIGVLDIDAPILDRFSSEDEAGLKACVDALTTHLAKCDLEVISN
ncbi:GAF domain-containing protein [Psychrobium sp. MM17-31]|uniref:GAF domain-containing protein n=1 Tax=Psychrobium sp. MM17-31 TaxID=2917758 RepID=UPI001EF53F6D|nr:GAF domain-containing protein [Psychrobium sp. MM17-31]MCG7529798.1 GAF domain-containing protein [Psychrobium sp. MM17-31]